MFQARGGSPTSSALPGVAGASHGASNIAQPGGHRDAAFLQQMLKQDKFFGTTASKHTTAAPNRVAFFYPASAVLGSHVHTDLDNYLALVRRKVQEKFATTVELITHIRRHRMGETGKVTPNEFRYTLIKLGVILPPATSDAVFNIFDSDRSGSINFDEFAMWVMNSEFKPKDKKMSNDAQSRVDFLRDKFTKWVKKHPDLMREQITSCPNVSFTKLFETINRKFMRMTEPEVRELFAILDLQVILITQGTPDNLSHNIDNIYSLHPHVITYPLHPHTTHRNKDLLTVKWPNNGSTLAKWRRWCDRPLPPKPSPSCL